MEAKVRLRPFVALPSDAFAGAVAKKRRQRRREKEKKEKQLSEVTAAKSDEGEGEERGEATGEESDDSEEEEESEEDHGDFFFAHLRKHSLVMDCVTDEEEGEEEEGAGRDLAASLSGPSDLTDDQSSSTQSRPSWEDGQLLDGIHYDDSCEKEKPDEPVTFLNRDQVGEMIDGQDGARAGVLVMTYNLLAPLYFPGNRCRSLASYAWGSRLHQIREEVQHYRPSILCLQEVQDFTETIEPMLQSLGYWAVFMRKSGGDRTGVAIAALVSAFRLRDREEIDFDAVFAEDETFQTHNNALIALVEGVEDGSEICVVSAHLHWDPTQAHIKTKQTHHLCHAVDAFISSWWLGETTGSEKVQERRQVGRKEEADRQTGGKEEMDKSERYLEELERGRGQSKEKGEERGAGKEEEEEKEEEEKDREEEGRPRGRIPLLLCGDFNSLPDSDVVRLLSSGRVKRPEKCQEELLEQPLDLHSAYAPLGHPPTNVTRHFVGCLDYIWFQPAYWHVSCLLQLVDVGDEDVFGWHAFLPNSRLPSDHMACAAALLPKEKEA